LISALLSGEKDGYSRVLDKAAANFDETNCASVARTMVQHGTWSVPTLVSEEIGANLTTRPRDEEYLALLPGNVRQEMSSEKIQQDNPPEKVDWLQRQRKNNLRIAALLHRRGVRMLAGSDSLDIMLFPGPTLHRELQLLVEIGLTPAEALRSATYDAAQFMHCDDRGTIEAGKFADLVVLNANPLADIRNTRMIRSVFVQGGIVYREAQSAAPSSLQK
jgi:imidazolonepropionase-like amidohydrolase